MSKFSGPTATVARPLGPLTTSGPATTYEGGIGFVKDPKTELFTLAVTNMVGEATFYESAGDRDNRFRNLIHQLATEDPLWLGRFIGWLRTEGNMRSASVVAAVEFAIASKGTGAGRAALVAACQRADEPAEALGYYLATYGRKIPMQVKRGIADAAVNVYTERAALKYDGNSRGVRMGDVIELCHPKAKAPWQNDLFKHLLDVRHGHYEGGTTGLAVIDGAHIVDTIPEDNRRTFLRGVSPETMGDIGYTWERLSGWLPGGMDAEAWEAIIPSMGYMALLRNLRNFEQANVSSSTLDAVAAKLADPDEVAKSRQFPYRFWSAYKNSGDRFTWPIAQALDASVANIPTLPGRTLVMVDTSGSMQSQVSPRSAVTMVEIGALFGSAIAARSNVDLHIYATDAAKANLPTSVLRSVQEINAAVGMVGHGTNTWPAVNACYEGQDRIIVLTDMQDHPSRITGLPNVPVYVWDLRGYQTANVDTSTRGRYLFGGFTDACFRMIPLLEAGSTATWPWA